MARITKINIKLLLLCFSVVQLQACVEPMNEDGYADKLITDESIGADFSEKRLNDKLDEQGTNSATSAHVDEYRIEYNDGDGDGVDEILFIPVNEKTKTPSRKHKSVLNDFDGDGLSDIDNHINKSDNQASVQESALHLDASNTQLFDMNTELVDENGDGLPD